MDKLIDADALWKEFDKAGIFDDENPRDVAQRLVEEAPDAIVRCKDCKYYHLYRYNNTPRGDGYCSIARMTNDGELYINVSDEHYCSYGERRSDG